jgi:hypothetical protein
VVTRGLKLPRPLARWRLGAWRLSQWVPVAHQQRTETHMLWTILIILVIVALVLFIFSRVRGGRRGL